MRIIGEVGKPGLKAYRERYSDDRSAEEEEIEISDETLRRWLLVEWWCGNG
jgi:hypothetical protein